MEPGRSRPASTPRCEEPERWVSGATQAPSVVVLEEDLALVQRLEVGRVVAEPVDDGLEVVLTTVRRRVAHPGLGGGEPVRRVGHRTLPTVSVVDGGEDLPRLDRPLFLEHLAVVDDVTPGEVHLIELRDERLPVGEGHQPLLDRFAAQPDLRLEVRALGCGVLQPGAGVEHPPVPFLVAGEDDRSTSPR